MFSPEQKQLLAAKLDATHVKQREQSGRKLSYIEGWLVISEANRIFGFDGWNRETIEIKQTHDAYKNEKGNWVVGYWAKVRVTVGSVVREGSGFGSGIDRDLGRAHESALKESETDSMKRALMTFGNPFGLALYDKTQENVETADQPARNGKATSAAAPATPPGDDDWQTVAHDVIREARELNTVVAVNRLLSDHKDQLARMEKSAPKIHAWLKEQITLWRGQLSQAPTKAA